MGTVTTVKSSGSIKRLKDLSSGDKFLYPEESSTNVYIKTDSYKDNNEVRIVNVNTGEVFHSDITDQVILISKVDISYTI